MRRVCSYSAASKSGSFERPSAFPIRKRGPHGVYLRSSVSVDQHPLRTRLEFFTRGSIQDEFQLFLHEIFIFNALLMSQVSRSTGYSEAENYYACVHPMDYSPAQAYGYFTEVQRLAIHFRHFIAFALAGEKPERRIAASLKRVAVYKTEPVFFEFEEGFLSGQGTQLLFHQALIRMQGTLRDAMIRGQGAARRDEVEKNLDYFTHEVHSHSHFSNVPTYYPRDFQALLLQLPLLWTCAYLVNRRASKFPAFHPLREQVRDLLWKAERLAYGQLLYGNENLPPGAEEMTNISNLPEVSRRINAEIDLALGKWWKELFPA